MPSSSRQKRDQQVPSVLVTAVNCSNRQVYLNHARLRCCELSSDAATHPFTCLRNRAVAVVTESTRPARVTAMAGRLLTP